MTTTNAKLNGKYPSPSLSTRICLMWITFYPTLKLPLAGSIQEAQAFNILKQITSDNCGNLPHGLIMAFYFMLIPPTILPLLPILLNYLNNEIIIWLWKLLHILNFLDLNSSVRSIKWWKFALPSIKVHFLSMMSQDFVTIDMF